MCHFMTMEGKSKDAIQNDNETIPERLPAHSGSRASRYRTGFKLRSIPSTIGSLYRISCRKSFETRYNVRASCPGISKHMHQCRHGSKGNISHNNSLFRYDSARAHARTHTHTHTAIILVVASATPPSKSQKELM